MTRKDYASIAAAMQRAYLTCEQPHRLQWRTAVEELAATLKSDNSRFDSERFINACYGGVVMIDFEYYRKRRWHQRRDTRRVIVWLPLFWLASMGVAAAFFYRLST